METIAVPVLDDADIEASLTTFARQPAGGLIAIPDSFTMEHRHVIIAQAAKHRLPALYANRLSAVDGGLMSYAVATAALKAETNSIPIIFVNVAEPIRSGFVESLIRPGGNLTGFTNFDGSIGWRKEPFAGCKCSPRASCSDQPP